MPRVTISSKRQITIPADIFRSLDLKEGQKLMAEVEGDRIILTARPDNLTRALSGAAKGIYGSTTEEADRYIEKERSSWHD